MERKDIVSKHKGTSYIIRNVPHPLNAKTTIMVRLIRELMYLAEIKADTDFLDVEDITADFTPEEMEEMKVIIDKEDIYDEYANIIEEDGTWSDLRKIYMAHSQTEPSILKLACQEMTEYVHFCLDCVVFYWSPSRKKYIQAGEDCDNLKWKISLGWSSELEITYETDLSTVKYDNITGLIEMHDLDLRYSELFEHLLDGNSYLEHNENQDEES